jgi:polysaccharide deacetylase 2 family uncharacterized protein YibQ
VSAETVPTEDSLTQRGTAPARRTPGLRALTWFWAVVLTCLGGGAAALQVLGPPKPVPTLVIAARPGAPATSHPPGVEADRGPVQPAAAGAPSPPTPEPSHTADSTGKDAEAVAAARQALASIRHAAGSPIAPPDPALLAPALEYPDARLPRIAADGRKPMEVYAGGFDLADPRPRVGLLLAGLGQSDVYSDDAARLLPAGVTFAVSPYANQPARLLDQIRARGHEFLLSLPMEPQNYPVNDAGPQSLLSGATPLQNQTRLDWALSRFAGYVGCTDALDGLRGERFAATWMQFSPVLQELSTRGLLFIDATPVGARTAQLDNTHAAIRSVDVVIDEPAVRVEIERKLASLEQIARDRGSAIGLAGLPRPVTIDRVAAWVNALSSHGIALAPISVLVLHSTTSPPVGSAPLNPPPQGSLTLDALTPTRAAKLR